MIEYLRGKVVERTPTAAVIEVAGGVGYLLSISLNTYNKIREGEEAKLLVHEVLREDTYDLYGFCEEAERKLFRLLVTVNGIGPATARLALSSFAPGELTRLIKEGNEAGLKAIKGVGVRTAQRIIVELKDKIEAEMGTFSIGIDSSKDPLATEHLAMYEEAEKAFVALGYPAAAARKVVAKLAKADSNMSINDMIRKGLQML
ncbi:Holliday junction branch migration protein RuvA [uncultured Porphyromonas sp.]|uniref:Holliday junction branch migration protein RuvA n=1 Tax=uncultured Porphyromonas sp. TaxID=159274 RepID=UPI0026307B5A|nr:Holliday junction branch migration protein RuvA [uncultured Porphyromonas sp.]